MVIFRLITKVYKNSDTVPSLSLSLSLSLTRTHALAHTSSELNLEILQYNSNNEHRSKEVHKVWRFACLL